MRERRERPSSDGRILESARRLVQRGGAAQVSMGDVAADAGVSKALVHYHFADKDSLLAALVESVGRAVLERAGASGVAGSAKPLDAHWAWFERELRAGDVRVLVSLADVDSAATRAVSRSVAAERLRLIAADVEGIFAGLGLTPRMPAALVAETVLAFCDGLACRVALEAVTDPRGAFDVLWLALLTLSE
ncbi:MAG TPA: helix-turn-helix domain-containing protein [Gemmatimonadaceae bacterium]